MRDWSSDVCSSDLLFSIEDVSFRQENILQKLFHYGTIRLSTVGDGEPYLLPGDALALVFARMINVTEEMLRDRLNTPSGFFTGESQADLLEAWHSGTSRQSFQASIDGLRRLLTGAGEGGIAALVAVKDGLISRKNPQLAQDIRSQLERIDEIGRAHV